MSHSDTADMRADIQARIKVALENFASVEAINNLSDSSDIAQSLELDSLDIVELTMAVEEEFAIEISDEDAQTLTSLSKMTDYLLTRI